MKRLILLMGMWLALARVGAASEVTELSYKFMPGTVQTYKLNIVREMNYAKILSSAAQGSAMSQTTTQDLTIELKVERVDMTGSAEILATFKSAKRDIKVNTGATREPKPPDTLRFLTGKSLTLFVTSEGRVLAVDKLIPLLVSLRDVVKDDAIMTMVEQDYTEDFFRELFQNLFVPMPLDPAKAARGWETVSDIPVPRTEYQLRVTTQATPGRIERGTIAIKVTGRVAAVPQDPDLPSRNPALPTLEVLATSISGEAQFSVDRSMLLQSQMVNDLTIRSVMKLRPPSGRGNELRSEVLTKTRTTTTVNLLK